MLALLGEAPPPGTPVAPPPVASQITPGAKPPSWWAKPGPMAAFLVLAFVGLGSGLYLVRFGGNAGPPTRNVTQASLGTGTNYNPLARPPTTPAATEEKKPDDAPATPPAAPRMKPEALNQSMKLIGRDMRGRGTGNAEGGGAGGARAAAAVADPNEAPVVQGAMDDALRVSRPRQVAARLVSNPHLKLRENQSIVCVMATATDSGAGLVRGECTTSGDVLSRTGTVRLIPNGSPVVIRGERQMANGESRILLTAAMVEVRIAGRLYELDIMSAVGDALGRTGVAGELDDKKWERMWDAVQLGIAGSAASATGQALASTGVPGAGTTQAVANVGTTSLRYRTRIPPHVRLRQGEVVVIHLEKGGDFSGQLQLAEIR